VEGSEVPVVVLTHLMEIVAGVPIQQHVAQHPDTGTEVEYLEWFLPTFSFQQVVYMHLQQVWEAQSRTELSSTRRSLDFDFATWPLVWSL